MNLYQLTEKLISIPSVTGQEAELADFLSDFLQARGFQVQPQRVTATRRNLLATTGAVPKVILSTHLDTVPPFIPFSQDDRFLYGRGACDAKAAMAAMLQAALRLRDEGRRDFGLLFVVGEEGDSIGAKRANELSPGSAFVVVGEPTENKLGAGHKGVLTLRLRATGRAGHSAFPHLGESAIDKLLNVLSRLRQVDLGSDPVLGESSFNIGKISGGVAHNVIPADAEAALCIRTAVPSHSVLERLHAVADGLVELETVSCSEPQRLFTLPGYEKAVLPFGTDLPYMTDLGKPLLIGPGSPEVAHTDSERVARKQLAQAVDLYADLVCRLSQMA